MSDTVAQHKAGTPQSVACAVVTLSTTRTLADDVSGATIKELLIGAGHTVPVHVVIKDDAAAIRNTLAALRADAAVRVIVMNGGTGLAPLDVTVETVTPLFDKPLAAFGTLFTMLSWEQVKGAAMLSRATAGIMGGKVVFCLPGSPKACKLGMEKLILPEIGHILKQIGS